MSHTAEVSYWDHSARALLALEVDCEIEPGRSEVRRADPGASDRGWDRHVEDIGTIRVTSVALFHATDDDQVVGRLEVADGTLSPLMAKLLARQVLARYTDDSEDGEVRRYLDDAILRYCV